VWDLQKWHILPGVIIALAIIAGAYYLHITRFQSRDQLQTAVMRELIISQENERKRIAGELHDSLGQDLLLITNRLRLLATTGQHTPYVAKQLSELSQTALQTIGDVRSISQALRPAALEQVGLTQAIEWMISQISDASSIRFTAEINNIDGVVAPNLEINLYRIVQEALNNVIKHAEARQVMIETKRDSERMMISIRDDGRGFPPNQLRSEQNRHGRKATLGLAGMAERAKLLGGKIEIQSGQITGTTVTFTMPLQPNPVSLVHNSERVQES